MNENGAKWQLGLNLWLAENWKILVVCCAVIAYGWRMETRSGDRYTGTQAEKEIGALFDAVAVMQVDIVDIKEDVAFLRGAKLDGGEE